MFTGGGHALLLLPLSFPLSLFPRCSPPPWSLSEESQRCSLHGGNPAHWHLQSLLLPSSSDYTQDAHRGALASSATSHSLQTEAAEIISVLGNETKSIQPLFQSPPPPLPIGLILQSSISSTLPISLFPPVSSRRRNMMLDVVEEHESGKFSAVESESFHALFCFPFW